MPRNSISSSCVSIHPRGYSTPASFTTIQPATEEWRISCRYKDRRKRINPRLRSQLKSGGMAPSNHAIAPSPRSPRIRARRTGAGRHRRWSQGRWQEQLETPKGILKRVLIPYFGDRPIQAITRPDIEEFRRDVLPSRPGENTANDPHRQLRAGSSSTGILFRRVEAMARCPPKEMFLAN